MSLPANSGLTSFNDDLVPAASSSVLGWIFCNKNIVFIQ
jgi:hypothetical protein